MEPNEAVRLRIERHSDSLESVFAWPNATLRPTPFLDGFGLLVPLRGSLPVWLEKIKRENNNDTKKQP
jgi:hypothetical protein